MTSQDLDNVRVIHGATRIVHVASVSVCYSLRLNLFFLFLAARNLGWGRKMERAEGKGVHMTSFNYFIDKLSGDDFTHPWKCQRGVFFFFFNRGVCGQAFPFHLPFFLRPNFRAPKTWKMLQRRGKIYGNACYADYNKKCKDIYLRRLSMSIPSRCSCLVQRRCHCLRTGHPDRTDPRVYGDPDPYSTTTNITNINTHILFTVLHKILMILVKRICLNIKTFHLWWSFPLFSRPVRLIKWWNCEEKLMPKNRLKLFCRKFMSARK